MNRKKLFDSIISRKDQILSGENIEKPEKPIEERPPVDVPKAYTRKFMQTDKDMLIQKIFLLSVENELLHREIDSLKSKLGDEEE